MTQSTRASIHSLVRLVLLVCFFESFVLIHPPVSAEDIVIDLRKGPSDPLIDFVPPPVGSPDRASFTGDGLRIQQTKLRKGQSTGIAGFKSTLAASGDFTVTLDAKINRLDAPSAGWGHGLIFAVHLDDKAQTTLKLNQMVPANGSQYQTVVEIGGRFVEQPTFAPGSVPLEDGKLIIARVGREAVFSMQQGSGESMEIARLRCPTADVRSVEVWSTRVEEGNAAADILLRTLTVSAEGFYTYKQPLFGWFSWWRLVIGSQVALIIGLLGYRVWQAVREEKTNRENN